MVASEGAWIAGSGGGQRVRGDRREIGRSDAPHLLAGRREQHERVLTRGVAWTAHRWGRGGVWGGRATPAVSPEVRPENGDPEQAGVGWAPSKDTTRGQ
jgi:hypothetical protein